MKNTLITRKPYLLLLLILLGYAAKTADSNIASAPEPPTLFTNTQTKEPLHYTDMTIKAKTVAISTALLVQRSDKAASTNSISLNLFSAEAFEISRTHLINNDSGSQTWQGEVIGVEGSSVIFVIRDNEVTGNILIPTIGSFILTPVTETVHLLEQIEEGADASDTPDAIFPKLSDLSATTRAVAGGDDGSIIDVYVAYDQDAVGGSVSAVAAQSYAELFIAFTNQAYENSNIDQRVWLVGTVDGYDYADSDGSSLSADLLKVSNGSIAGLKVKRDEYHADLVLFFVPYSGGSCEGMAYIQTTQGNLGFENHGYSVMEACPFGQTVFAHELGHNMGGRHDWFADNTTDPVSNTHGYVYPENRSRTIMASNSRCAELGFFCSRVPYFSNPTVTYNGVSMGVSAGTATNCAVNDVNPNVDCDADHTSYFNSNAATTAQFRDSQLTWTGQVDSDWNNAKNWSINEGAPSATKAKNRVPRAFDNVIIPSGLNTYPILETGQFSARELYIKKGASLTMLGGLLTVGWKWRDEGGFVAEGGAVEFSGPIGVSVSSQSTFHDIAIGSGEDSSAVSLLTDLSVRGDVEIQHGASLLAGNNDLIVAGNWRDLGDGFAHGSSKLVFSGDDQAVESSGAELRFYDLQVASGAVTFNRDVVVWHDFEIGAGVTADILTHTLKVGGTATNNGTLLGNPIEKLKLLKIYFPIMNKR